ncbi:hypothetical protein K493DRAFT_295099 [Basidiobolus meristosporus CBS 931.73]|uniref:Securin n=1 Tax=Basidiobolus meristosporus CBS 931.73 TaxID=1314790 RepID=A0A1Y1ZEB6_9FUNG|nr:hypothetical protein K493DRAFT_295099 [Basidiobolus meristosporus CBS 931.73]|eukprot:ORY08307.1 hypothetical protein K493DRAFT_295099 [Basidiobolus meristosporus CBS 931.73]
MLRSRNTHLDKENEVLMYHRTPGRGLKNSTTNAMKTKTPHLNAKTPFPLTAKTNTRVATENRPALQAKGKNLLETTARKGGFLKDITNKTPAPGKTAQKTTNTNKKAPLGGSLKRSLLKDKLLAVSNNNKAVSIEKTDSNPFIEDCVPEEVLEAPKEEDFEIEYMPPKPKELPYDPGFDLDFDDLLSLPTDNFYMSRNADKYEPKSPDFSLEDIGSGFSDLPDLQFDDIPESKFEDIEVPMFQRMSLLPRPTPIQKFKLSYK